VKAANAARGGRAAVCQVDGRRWLTLEGTTRVLTAPDEVADAEARYAVRYRQPRPNPQRVVVVLDVDRALGSADPPPLRDHGIQRDQDSADHGINSPRSP
jgi:hypothetical protein